MRHAPQGLMIFAAGFGTRMGALTATRPKPLIEVAGRPLIDHALDLAAEAGPLRTVVNLHYLGERIAEHLARRDVALAWERGLILDTGGGLRAALPLLPEGPVYTLNPDAIWTGANPLVALREAWDPERMSALLLLGRVGGRADFTRDAAGRIGRAMGAGYRYLGAQILDPAGLAGIEGDAFSLNVCWDRLIAQRRAFGIVHTGGWCDVGQPAGIAEAEALLARADVR